MPPAPNGGSRWTPCLHAFRLGGSLVWQGLVEETSRTAPEDVRLLVHVASNIWNFVDEHCTLVADAYRQVERQLDLAARDRVWLLAAALLDGASPDRGPADRPGVAGPARAGGYAVVAVAGEDPTGIRPSPAVAADGARGTLRVHWHTGVGGGATGIVLVGAAGGPRRIRGVAFTGPRSGPAAQGPRDRRCRRFFFFFFFFFFFLN